MAGKAPTRITGNKIGEILKEKGKEQKWLADRCKTTPSLISKLVNNKRPSISLEMAARIAKALNKQIDEVFPIKKP